MRLHSTLCAIAFAISSPAFGQVGSYIDVDYGPFIVNPPMNNTFRIIAVIDDEDIDYYAPIQEIRQNSYYQLNGVSMPVLNSQNSLPIAPDVKTYFFQILTGSPVPPEAVGNWRLDAWLVFIHTACDYWVDPPNCTPYPAHSCSSLNEPCHDYASGYIN